MRKKEKISVLLVIVLCMGGGLAAQEAPAAPSPQAFNQLVSLDWSLERLSASVTTGKIEQIPKDKYLLIEGIVSTRQVVQPDEENYFAILEVSSADWNSSQELSMYRCYFRLEGSEFFGMVPAGRGQGGPGEVPLHAHVLAIGSYLGYGQDNQGNRFPVLKALDIKLLQQ